MSSDIPIVKIGGEAPKTNIRVAPGKCTTAGYFVFAFLVIIGLYAFGLMVAIWSSNDYSLLDQYFGMVFALTAVAMILPVRDTAKDINPSHCWQKSWHHFYNLVILFTVSMFLIFVAVTIMLLNGVFPDSLAPEKTAVIGITAGLCLGLLLIIFKGTDGVTYMFTFWLLLMIIVSMNLPLPYAWMNIVGGLVSALLIVWLLMTGIGCIARTQALHEHFAVGLAFVWSIYSFFGDWRYWYTRPFRDYGALFAIGFAAGAGRALWRYFLFWLMKKYDGFDPNSVEEIALTGHEADVSDTEEADEKTELMRVEYPTTSLLVRGPSSSVSQLHRPQRLGRVK
jgi:hypothetical protein